MDMMVLAFQTDSTRTRLSCSPMMEATVRSKTIPEGHHNLSHHKKKKDNLEKIQKIDEFYLTQLAYFLDRRKKPRTRRPFLYNSMVVYEVISDGDRHNHDDLPVILAGNGGGAFQPGRHVDLGQKVPLSNFVRMLNEFKDPRRRLDRGVEKV